MAVVERWDLLSFGHHIAEYWLTLSANTLSTYQSNISGHVNWVSVLSVYISRPISLKPDWIQLCVTVGWLINTVYHKRIQGGGKLKKEHRAWSLLSLKRKAPYIRQCGAYLRKRLIIPVNSKTAHLPQGTPQASDWSFALYSLWKQPFFLTPCSCKETFHEEELLWLNDKKFHNDNVKSVWNQVHEEPHKVPFTNFLEWRLLCLIFCYTRGC